MHRRAIVLVRTVLAKFYRMIADQLTRAEQATVFWVVMISIAFCFGLLVGVMLAHG